MNVVTIDKIGIGSGNQFVLLAGPCVIEDEKKTLEIAKELQRVTEELSIPFIFKASFDKANRTSISSYRGPGLREGMRILQKVKSSVGVPVLTDIHQVDQVDLIASIADIVQIPAFLCRQTDLVVAVAKSAAAINIKKGQFLAPWDVKNIIDKAVSAGAVNIMITERGTSFGYNQLITDMRALPLLRGFGYPVIFDATHSVQMPGGKGDATGGDRKMIPYLARAALAAGCEGVFMEVHPDPDKALSDGPNSFALSDLPELLEQLKAIDEVVKKCKNWI